jgi:hypothetical protein
VDVLYIPAEYELTINFYMPNMPLQTQAETAEFNSDVFLAFPVIEGYTTLINGVPYAAGTYTAEWQNGSLSMGAR